MLDTVKDAANYVATGGDNGEIERLRQRRELKRQLIKEQIKDQRRGELHAAIDRVNADLDAATVRHAAACEPIQRKLSAIEAEQVELAIDGTAVDPKLASRRQELLDKLHVNNVALEQAASDSEHQRAPLGKELRELRPKPLEPTTVTIESDLVRLASLGLQCEMHVLQCRHKWLLPRMHAADDLLEKARFNLEIAKRNRSGEGARLVINTIAIWQAELNAVRVEIAEANRQMEATRQRMIGE